MPSDFVVILFYTFQHIADPEALASAHREKCTELGFLGRMLVAEEGVNATFEGTRENVEEYKKYLKNEPIFQDVVVKESAGDGKGFRKLFIRVRPEVVTLSAGTFDVQKETASKLSPKELEKWYEENEDFVVLDLRNDYEIACGKFEKTEHPDLGNFRELPEKIKNIAHLKNKKVVAVCTGGIRCEKATCFLKKEGFSNLYQLEDGIHTYMKEFPNKHFKGSLFVFDNRLMTDVVPAEGREIIGRCIFCNAETENYCADLRVRPSKKVLCCISCSKKEGAPLRQLSKTS